MINGLGKTTFSFIINFLSLCIRIAGVCLFIPIWGINGYLTGLLISQIFLFLCCMLRLVIYIKNFFIKRSTHSMFETFHTMCRSLSPCVRKELPVAGPVDHLQCFQKHSDNDRIHITFCYHSQQHQHYQFYSFSGIPPDHRIFQHIFKQ